MTDTTTTNSAATPAAAVAKPKTVADDMASRSIFPSVEEATAYLGRCAETLSDWGSESIPVAMAGQRTDDQILEIATATGVEPDAVSPFDPAVYTDSMDVMVAKLTSVKKGDVPASVKAIVIAPIPKLDLSSLGDDSFGAWAKKIIHKELNHVAVRQLRDAEDVSTVVDQIPTTLTGYIESGRAGGGMLETFNELYKSISQTLSAIPAWAKLRLIKQEIKKAMESKGYALEFYPTLEEYGPKKESLFEAGIKLGTAAAKRKGMDPAIFDRWASTRASKSYDPTAPEDEEALDLDAMTLSLLGDPAATNDEAAPVPAPTPEAEPAAETEAPTEA